MSEVMREVISEVISIRRLRTFCLRFSSSRSLNASRAASIFAFRLDSRSSLLAERFFFLGVSAAISPTPFHRTKRN